MFKKATVLAAALAALSPVVVRAETLADALVSAYNSSGLLEQNRALLRAADEDVAQTVAQLRPIVSWSSDFTQEFGQTKILGIKSTLSATGVNLGITGTMLVYDFGRRRYQIESAKENVLATRESLIGIEQQVLLRGVYAYMNVIRAQRVVDLRQNNLRVLNEELRATRDRFDVGEVTRTDIAQSEARVARARSGLALATGDLEQARAEYVAAVGKKAQNLKWPSDRPRFKSLDQAEKTALQKHPALLAADHSVAAADLTIQAADQLTKPNVSLFAQAGINESLDNSNYVHGGTVGIEIGGPIYQGGQLSSIRRQAIALRDAQLGSRHETRMTIQRNVRDAYAALQAAIASKAASEEEVRAAKIAFDGVREEAQLGSRTTIDVLNAEQDYLNARVTRVSAEVDVYNAAYTVLSAMGELTVRDLGLKAQTYDPTVYYNLAKDAPVTISPQGQKLEQVLKALGKQ